MKSNLNVSIFEAPEKELVGDRSRPFGPSSAFDPMTSTLIYGENDAVLVDPLTTEAEATALAMWVKLFHRRLKYIYITHGHMDHIAGSSVLKKYFPEVKVIGTPGTVELAKSQIENQNIYRKRWPGLLSESLISPLSYSEQSFEIENHVFKIINQGTTDAPGSTSLYVPDLELVVAGDVVYNHCQMFVGALTDDIYKNWLKALERIDELNPKIVVAGHKKPGTPNSPVIVNETRNYLKDFYQAKINIKNEEKLFNYMGEKYPNWAAHQAWLMFGF